MSQKSQLIRQLRSVTSPDDVRRILLRASGKQSLILATVAETCRVFDESLALICLAGGVPPKTLIENSAFPAELHELVALWSLDRLASEQRKELSDRAAQGLVAVFKKGRIPPDGDAFAAVLAFAARKKPTGAQVEAARAIGMHPGARADDLKVAFEATMRLNKGVSTFLAVHRNAPIELARALAPFIPRWTHVAWDSIEMLLAVERIRKDPVVRAALTQAGANGYTAITLRLAEDGGDDLVPLFLSALPHKDCVRLLERLGPRIMAGLTEAQVANLLGESDRDIRLATIGALGAAGREVPGAPKQRAPKREAQ